MHFIEEVGLGSGEVIMIRKPGKDETILTSVGLAMEDRKPTPKSGSFVTGFIEGFGSVGYTFAPAKLSPGSESLTAQLAKSPASQHGAVVLMAKRRMAAKYVGKAMANKICSVYSGTGEGRTRQIDALMIQRDLATAISKLHG